jgi:hypothetical protein
MRAIEPPNEAEIRSAWTNDNWLGPSWYQVYGSQHSPFRFILQKGRLWCSEITKMTQPVGISSRNQLESAGVNWNQSESAIVRYTQVEQSPEDQKPSILEE